MNFQDFFRGFVGPHHRNNWPGESNEDPVNKFRNPPWGDDPDEDDDFDELYSDYRSERPGSRFGFNMFSGDVMQMHRFFEQQMNEMMRSFGSFGLGSFDFSQGLEGLPETKEEGPRIESIEPRDKYLKSAPKLGEPRFSASSIKTDSDLDDRISSDGIGTLFKKDTEEARRAVMPMVPKTFSRSFTSRIIISNNGRVEEKVKEWKSDGTGRETVKRSLGDESHSVTTTTDPSGQVQQHEELVNIDQDNLSDFNKKWSSNGGRSEEPFSALTSPPRTGISVPAEPNTGFLSSLWRLFS